MRIAAKLSVHKNAWPKIVFLAAGCLVALPLACMIGPYYIEPSHVLRIFAQAAGFGNNPNDAQMTSLACQIIVNLRLPRVAIAFLCGGILALSGVVLQGVLRNPLADPFTLGISAGAACGASLAIVFAGIFPWLQGVGQELAISSSALAGSILALACCLILGRGKGAFEKENLILAGIAVAAFMGALVALIKALNEESVTSIVFWIMGSLQGCGWHNLPIILILLAPGLVICCLGWRKLDILALGDAEAAALGLPLARTRLLLLGGASIMTAGCVAICGVIGFVGLVAPHILRNWVGPAHGPLMGAAFLGGGLFLLLSDSVARIILDGGQELPVGVLTALVGGPFFAFLVWKR